MPVKRLKYTDSNLMSLTGCGFSDYLGTKIIPVQKMGASNRVSSSTGNGDALIGVTNYAVDGDLIISTGWGDGLGIRQLNNDGTTTQLFGKTDVLNPITGYKYIQSIAVAPERKRIVVMTYPVSAYTIWDYSNVKIDGTVTQLESGTNFITSDQVGINVDRVGDAYYNGMAVAGDWVYVGDRDASHYKKFPRRHIMTGEQELLDGTSVVNRNGYRYKLNYDEVNDRVFYYSYYNGSFAVITDASTANPQIKFCDMASLGYGDDNYELIHFIPDPYQQPNVLYVSTGDNYITKIDMTPCINGTSNTPTVLVPRVHINQIDRGERFDGHIRGTVKYCSTDGDATDRMITNPTQWFPFTSDRGYLEIDGWFDMENNKIVAFNRYSRIVEDTTTFGRGRSINTDYASNIFTMTSADGSRFYIKMGYGGSDGHRVNVWDDTYGMGLIGNWEFVYGPITGNYNTITVSGDSFVVPSGCTIDYFVSNDSGATWHNYDYDNNETKYFNNSGDGIMFKVVATGSDIKAPYYSSSDPLVIVYKNEYRRNLPGLENVKSKITKFKLGGAR